MAYASFLQRISSATIDLLIFLFTLSFFVRGSEDDPVRFTVSLLVTVTAILFLTAVLSYRYSGTPGNLLLNCQIVDAETGNPITFRQSLHRSVGLFWTLASLGLGLLWILFDKDNQALHDKIANTIVVYNSTIDMFDESQKTLQQLLSELR